jgi:hypothetical protein
MLDVFCNDPRFFYDVLHDVGFCTESIGIIYQVNDRCIDANTSAVEMLGVETGKKNKLLRKLIRKNKPFVKDFFIDSRWRLFKIWPHKFCDNGTTYQLSFIKRLR